MDYKINHNSVITREMRLEIETMLDELSSFTQAFKRTEIHVSKSGDNYSVTVEVYKNDQDKMVTKSDYLEFTQAIEMSKENILNQLLTEVVLLTT